ncbi:MAG TPA: 5'-nucleotidase C-terminal domain-containing protein, partial [Longimicrobiales bacterium]|nr:5'-nucleotidase C-terminal domain-containing protein [Longimicrobiales bacterium]
PIVSSGEYGARLSIVELERITPDSVEATFVGQPATWADEVDPDPGVAALMAKFEAQAGELLNRVVATLAGPLERGTGEFPLGNLIADSKRAALDSDIAIINTGGIRTSLPAGDVRYEDAYRVLPFGNRLVLLQLSGATVRAAVEHALTGGRAAAHFSGLRATYDPAAPAGARLVTLTLDSGEPVEDWKTYTVTVNAFLAEGGDGYEMLLDGDVVDSTHYTDMDAFVRYLESLPSPVSAPEEQRLAPVAAPTFAAPLTGMES